MTAAMFDGILIGIASEVWKRETDSQRRIIIEAVALPLPPLLRRSPDPVGTTEAFSLTLHEMMAAVFDGILIGIAAAVWKSETSGSTVIAKKSRPCRDD